MGPVPTTAVRGALGLGALSCLVIGFMVGLEHLWWPVWYDPVLPYTRPDLPVATLVILVMAVPTAVWAGLGWSRR